MTGAAATARVVEGSLLAACAAREAVAAREAFLLAAGTVRFAFIAPNLGDSLEAN